MYSDDKYQYYKIGDSDTVMMWLQKDDEWNVLKSLVGPYFCSVGTHVSLSVYSTCSNCQWFKIDDSFIGRPFSGCTIGCVIRRPLPIHQFSRIKKPNRYQILRGL